METVPDFSITIDALPVSVFETNAKVGQAAASDAAAFLRQTIHERDSAALAFPKQEDAVA